MKFENIFIDEVVWTLDLIKGLILVNGFVNSKIRTITFIVLFSNFILQFENYWMIINADPI